MRFFWLQILLSTVGSVAMGLLSHRIWPEGGLLLLAGVMAGSFFLLEHWLDAVFRGARERDSNQRLREIGLPLCTCGYSLAGLTEPRCPECGQPFDADAAWFRRSLAAWDGKRAGPEADALAGEAPDSQSDAGTTAPTDSQSHTPGDIA